MKAICPFDESHHISLNKLRQHIIKCKATNRSDYDCCQYNDLHWVKFTEIKRHEQTCQYRNKKPTMDHNEQKTKQQVNNDNKDKEITQVNKQWQQMSSIAEHKVFLSKRRNKNIIASQEPTDTINPWEQPDFQSWYSKRYGKTQGNQQGGISIDDDLLQILDLP